MGEWAQRWVLIFAGGGGRMDILRRLHNDLHEQNKFIVNHLFPLRRRKTRPIPSQPRNALSSASYLLNYR